MASTDPFASLRQQMVQDQLQARGIHDQRVLDVMARVPREKFLPAELTNMAYTDRALEIECCQTISQPYIVALMTEALALTGIERVLEIGTGSGYQTAILAELAAEVISIERHAPLSTEAGRVLHEQGYTNITLVVGDGRRGWPSAAPYDRMIVTAAAERCPPALYDQLRVGGILVIPLGESDSQMLERIEKLVGTQRVTNLTACRFVPLVDDAKAETKASPSKKR